MSARRREQVRNHCAKVRQLAKLAETPTGTSGLVQTSAWAVAVASLCDAAELLTDVSEDDDGRIDQAQRSADAAGGRTS